MVTEVDSGASTSTVGDQVFGYNEGPFGAHAQYLAVPADGSLTTMPANLSYAEAAPSTEGSHYALAHLKGAKITAGQVVVYGVTGAIGSAAVQLLKSVGVTVTAATATANMDPVKGLGADRVIDDTTEDFTKDDQTYDPGRTRDQLRRKRPTPRTTTRNPRSVTEVLTHQRVTYDLMQNRHRCPETSHSDGTGDGRGQAGFRVVHSARSRLVRMSGG